MSETNATQDIAPLPDLSELPTVPQSALDLSGAVRLRVSQIPALGIAFSTLAEALVPIASATTDELGESLYRVMDAAGHVLTPDMLHAFTDGSGYLGLIKGGTTLGQARLNPVLSQGLDEFVAIDPVSLFAAAALMQVHQKTAFKSWTGFITSP